jgi:DUF971 family protein
MSPMPVEIDRSAETRITVRWDDGHRSDWTARELRLLCPCASCVDEMTGEPILDPATVPADVRALGARLVGRYAVEFKWSDGHSTGMYTFELLRAACPCEACAKARSA